MKSNKIKIGLRGIRPIMFDRFASMKTELAPEEKVYSVNGNLTLPSKNIMSFLTGVNTESAPKRTIGKKWKTVAKAAMSFVNIEETDIFFTRNGKNIDAKDVTIVEDKAIVMKGSLSIPSPKSRPVVAIPWELNFELELFHNDDLNDAMLKKLFEEGGLTIGFGTYRGVYGKFVVDSWVVK